MEENKKNEEKTLTKPQVAMLVMAGIALVLIMAFSCYGCSYQPTRLPDEQAAQDVFRNLYSTSWSLDTAAGIQAMEEFGEETLNRISFGRSRNENGVLPATLELAGSPSIVAEMAFREGYGFYLSMNGEEFPATLTYSQSKDGKTETITLIGNESNTHWYYLKEADE